MLLPGVLASALPTQNDEMWDGLQEGTEEEFDEATNAYVEVCNNAQVWARPSPHPRDSLAAHAGEHRRACA